jgi:hypothetical protein
MKNNNKNNINENILACSLVELVELIGKMNFFLKIQTIDMNIGKIINSENVEKIDTISSNINFTQKYVCFKSLGTIFLKKKIQMNLDSENFIENDKLFIPYKIKKQNPIMIKSIKECGFLGTEIKKNIEEIIENLFVIYMEIYNYMSEYSMNKNLFDEIGKYFLFYKDQYDKFVILNDYFELA